MPSVTFAGISGHVAGILPVTFTGTSVTIPESPVTLVRNTQLDDKTLDPLELRRAIEATFARRKMALPSCGSSLPSGLSDLFAQNALKQTQWKAFLRKNGLGALALALGDVVARLRNELEMIGVI